MISRSNRQRLYRSIRTGCLDRLGKANDTTSCHRSGLLCCVVLMICCSTSEHGRDGRHDTCPVPRLCVRLRHLACSLPPHGRKRTLTLEVPPEGDLVSAASTI